MSLRWTHQRLRVGCRASGPRSAGHGHPPLDRGAPVIQRPPLATLLGSLVAHGGVLAILFFLVSEETHPGVLLIDLEAVSERDAPAESRASSGGATGDRVASGTGQGGGGGGRATPGAGVAPSGPAGGAPGAEYGGYLASVRRRI